MPYKYSAYTADKRVVQGIIDVTSESIAEETLHRTGYQRILSLREVPPGPSLAELIPTLFGVKTREIIEFLLQLATLIESGINLMTALQLLEGQTSGSAFKKVIGDLIEGIQGGSSLSHTLTRHPKIFSNSNCQVIKASEHSGNLEIGLRQIVTYMEKRAAITQRIQRALAYPLFILLMAAAVVVLLMTVALPPLVHLFTSLGAELPWTTKLLITVTDFVVNNQLYLLGGFLSVIALVAVYAKLPSGKLAVDRLMLKLPVFGTISIEHKMSHFCQITSMLLKAGLQLPQAIEIVIPTIGNSIIRQALSEVAEKMVQGQGLSQPMSEIKLFPQLLVEITAVGEKTGTLDGALTTAADIYERRADRKIDILTSMLEPLLTVAIGLIVIFIALSMVTPLYSVLRSV
ncbi:type II secretion system F family protein [Chloroflexota bacterium]